MNSGCCNGKKYGIRLFKRAHILLSLPLSLRDREKTFGGRVREGERVLRALERSRTFFPQANVAMPTNGAVSEGSGMQQQQQRRQKKKKK